MTIVTSAIPDGTWETRTVPTPRASRISWASGWWSTPLATISVRRTSNDSAFPLSTTLVITDHFVICTASSDRQVKSVLEAIEEAIRGLGERPTRREGEAGAGWSLLDYIDVVVHVFGTEEREYYDLERLWRDAPRLAWEQPAEAATGR